VGVLAADSRVTCLKLRRIAAIVLKPRAVGLFSNKVQGLNDRFTKKPVQFLHECEICESLELQGVKMTPAGVYNFDLVPHAFYGTSYALISLAPKNGNAGGEDPFKAYWLPWKSREAPEIVLEDEADFFFTSRLGGCQLRIIPPAGVGTRTKVVHISGNSTKEWRAQKAKEALKLSEWHRSRTFSSTVLIPEGGYMEVTEKDEKQGQQEVNVVGFKGRFTWEFWAQQVDRAIDNKIRRVWKIH
jgi:hypothetical protein